MPTIVQTVTGKVTGLWGTAKIRDAHGAERELQLGDIVNRGDVILTSPDGIVQLTPERDATAPAAPRVPPVDTSGGDEIDRVISGLDQPQPSAGDAPSAGLAGGGEGDLQPGLRVDRVVEAVTPASLSTTGPERATIAVPDGTTAREAANLAPTADAASRQLAEDTPLTLALTGRDADGSIRAVTVTTLPAHGTLALADGMAVAAGQVLTPEQAAALRFTPDAGFNGDTAVGFTVTDNDGATSAPASVAINVTPVNDAPAATPATLTVAEDTPLVVSLTGTDADGRIATVTVTQLPDHGTLFLPDGTTPVAAGSPLAPADAARLVFVPAADFHGDAVVVFTVTDDGGAVSTPARVAIGVSAVNDPPVARNDTTTTDEDTPLTLTPAALLGNDSDADGDPLTLVSVQNPVGGTVALVGGNVVFTPAPDFNGPASFSYTTSDGHGGSATATVAVNVAPVADPAISIGDVTVDERAGVATFVVTLSEPTTATVSVGFATVDGSASSGTNGGNSSGSPVDYTAVNGTLTFAPGVTSQTISVPIVNDRVFEGAETFTVALRTPVNATLARATGTGTITDDGSGPPSGGPGQPADDDRPTLSVTAGNVVEGDFAVFSVALSNPSTQPVVFTPALVSGSATVGTDTGPFASLEQSLDGGASWSPVSGNVVVPPNALSVLLRVPTTADGLNEGTEAFSLTATPVSGGAGGTAVGEATLIDADGSPTLFIGDVSVDEAAGTATFTVSLSTASALPVTVGFSTADIAGARDGATAGSDYTAVSGTLAFAPGVLRQTITVPITDDAVFEGAERFQVVLSAPVNALLADDTGIGTIKDDGTGPAPAPGTLPDDDTPAVGSVSSPSVIEGGGLDFAVGLTHTSTTPTTVVVVLAAGSATLGTDTSTPLQVSFDGGRTFVPLAGATIEVPAGAAGFIVRVPTIDDALTEPTEGLTLSASTAANPMPVTGSGSIVDNDGTPALSISGPPTIDEAAGTATYTVVLSHPSSSVVTVAYGTVDGTATAGQDFTATSGTLTFAPNELTKTITVVITNDAVFEGPEGFTLALSAPVGATLAGSGAVESTIVDDGSGPPPGPGASPDDDTPAVGSVSSPTVVEGGALDFVVGLTHVSTTPTPVTLTPASGSATLGTDTSTPLLVSFDGGQTFALVGGSTVDVPAGVGSFVVRVPTIDDALSENTETLTLAAATPSNPAPVVGSGTIVDNDGTPVASISGPAVVDEAAGTVTYTVALSHASASTVTVAYGTRDGTAVAGQDFTAAAGTLTFAPNELTKTVTVAITNDAVFEGPESFSLALSAPVGATLGSSAVATTTIRDDGTGPGANPDDDTPRIGSVSSPAVAEGGNLDFTVALTHASTTPTTVALSLASGTATVGTDTAGPLQVSFDGGRSFAPVNGATVDVPAGVGSFVVRTATLDDAISEPTESLTLSASTPTGPGAAAVVGSGTITDNDGTPVLSISGPAVVDEAAGTVTYTVTLSNPSASTVSVAYGAVDGSAVGGQDFTAATGTLTFAPNELTKTVTVAITNDAVFEGPESFSVALSAPVGATLASAAAVATTSIRDDGTGPSPGPSTTPDDDRPAVGSVSSPTAVEGGALDFVVGLTHASTTPTTVTLAAASAGTTGSATLGVDTTGGPLQVSFDGGQTFTALAGGPTVEVPAGIGSFVVRVATVDDALSEPTETLTLAASTPLNAAPVVGTGTIVDNDGTPELAVSGPAVIDEAAGTATYTVTLSHPSASTVGVGYGTVDGTAVAGQDFTATNGTLTFAPNELTKTITVAIRNDSVFEGSETFSLALNTPVGATIGTSTVVSTIKDDGSAPGNSPDNDMPSLALTGPAVIDEAAGTATYTVTLSNPSTTAVTVDYGTVDGTAVAGQDFTAASGTLTFAAGELTKTVTVAIRNDSVFEGSETFSLALNTPVGATIGTGTVVSTIKDDGSAPGNSPDNDMPSLALTGPAVIDEAAGTATYTVTLSNPSTTAVTVDYGTVDGTAVAGQDFTAASGTLTFAAGELTKTVTVAIRNDSVFEGSETFSLALNTPVGATIGAGTVVSTIKDDGTAPGTTPDNDTPKLAITGPAVIDEAAGTATYTVTLSNPSTSAVTVGYGTVNGTAVAGQDFTATNGTLTFAPNELTKTITVAINNDAVFEGSETFSVALNSPTGATIATGSVVSTIKDDGTAPGATPDNDTPKLAITGPAVIDEAAGTATYTVSLSNPSTTAVTVGYGTVNGTAVAGQDFTATNGTLTFAPNELTKTITVSITNDTVFEGSETFSVALNSPSGATIATGTVVSTIKDDGTGPGTTPNDDRPAIGSVSSPSITEGGNLDFAVRLTHASTTATTVALTPASGSATLGTDTAATLQVSFNGGSTFAAVSGATVAVPAGVTDFIVRVATVDDRLIEPTETITLTVSTPGNAGAAAVVATGSIVDNEQTFFADAASGLRGEYYGYNETKTTAAGARTHSDDGTATFGNHNAAGNLNSVEDMYTVIDGRNQLGGGSASLVGSAASAAKDVADVVFSARSIDYGFNPQVSGALGSNTAVAAGSALPSGDGNANSTTRSLENFLDQDRPTAVAQVGAGNTNGTSGLGTTTDAAIRVAGQIYVQPGSYDFRVTADDGFRLNVAGKTLLEYDGNQSPTTRIFNHVQLGDAGGGLQAMELLYWEQGGDARLRIEYKSSNDADSAYKLLDVTNTAMFSSENAPVFSNPLIQDLVRDDTAGGWRLRTGVALDGTSGNDTLNGTDGRDVLNGGDGNDTLNGGAGADTLNGGAGNDALNGGAGSDRLTGGAGADTLTGGTGDDTYVLSDRLDTIVENANEGIDTVVLDATYVAANAGSTYTLGTNLENATAEGTAAINLTGNAADNRLEGNAAANTLNGGDGADVLIGGGGNDRLTGGAGHDVFEWRLADAGTPGAPAVDTIIDFTYGGGYSNVQPTSGGDVLDLRDLLQGEHSSSGVTNNAAGAVEISNLLNYIDVQVSGADTVLHISKNGGFTGGTFSAGAEDQTIVLQNVNLYSATGVTAGDESSLLKTLIKNGTMVID